MQTVISTENIHAVHQHAFLIAKPKQQNGISRFLTWCEAQEEERFFWLGVAFLGTIGMALPLTLLAAGSNFSLWIIACIANVPVLAINLAAQHTKVTLPFLFSAWIINALIIIYGVSLSALSS